MTKFGRFFGSAAIGVAMSGAAVHAAPSSSLLMLNQVSSAVDMSKVRPCSKDVTTNCKKRSGNTWLIVGGVALAAAIGLAAGSGGGTASP